MKCFLLWLVLGWLAIAGCGAQQDAPIAPLHPVSEATLQEYFDVCHFATRNREALQVQFVMQQKTLPPWFPAEVWDQMVSAVLKLDVTPIALPVYQKYMSENAARNAIRLFVTPVGQQMLAQVSAKTIDGETSGEDAMTAHKKAIDQQRAVEDAKIHEMLAAMTPQQKRETETFLHSAEWQNLNTRMPAVLQDFNQAYLAAQKQALHTVTEAHKTELQQAFRDYQKAHPGADK